MPNARLPFRVLVITDEHACARVSRGVVETIARALWPSAPGVAVLVRAPDRSLEDVRVLCAALQPIARRAQALLLVHTHVQLVGALGLHGAHVNAHTDVREARAQLPPGALLGASRHDGDPLDEEALAPLDYVTLSPLFAPSSKPASAAHATDARASLGVAALARSSAKPLDALGGINERRAAACFRAGADAVAVIGAVMHAHDPRRALLEL